MIIRKNQVSSLKATARVCFSHETQSTILWWLILLISKMPEAVSYFPGWVMYSSMSWHQKKIWKLPFINKAFQMLLTLAEAANVLSSYFFFRHEQAYEMKGKLSLFKALSKPRNLTHTAVLHKSFRSLLLWENRYTLTRATFQILFVRQNLQAYISKKNQVMT